MTITESDIALEQARKQGFKEGYLAASQKYAALQDTVHHSCHQVDESNQCDECMDQVLGKPERCCEFYLNGEPHEHVMPTAPDCAWCLRKDGPGLRHKPEVCPKCQQAVHPVPEQRAKGVYRCVACPYERRMSPESAEMYWNQYLARLTEHNKAAHPELHELITKIETPCAQGLGKLIYSLARIDLFRMAALAGIMAHKAHHGEMDIGHALDMARIMEAAALKEDKSSGRL